MMNGRPTRTDEEPCDGRTSDRQLLAEFVDHHDEEAFARLVARYCGLVLGVCRRTLRDEHGAEDAFQATFLVLARRASRVRNRASLAGWLYAVALRTALRAKAQRHRRREQALPDDMTANDDTLAQVTTRYEQQLLDEEIDRLPAKYREPLVLRYLMGKSNSEVARDLGLRLGVVEGRLKRGKDRLRVRLVRRGIGVTVALAAVGAALEVEAAAADSLIAVTAQAAAAFRSGAQPTGNLSRNAVRLAQQELAMSTSTVAVTTSGLAAGLVLVGLTLGLAGYAAEQPAHAQPPEIAASAAIDPSAAPSAEEELAPFRLAAAEKPQEAQDANQASLAGKRDEPAEHAAKAINSRRMNEHKLLRVLDETTHLEFIDAPLSDLIEMLEEMHAIRILIDQRALEDQGISPDEPVTFRIRDVSLQSALNLLLRDLDLTWTIRDEVLLITTRGEAEMMLIAKVYEVGDLVTCQDKSGELWADYDSLIEVITTTIKPDTWEDVGGAGSVVPAPFRGAEMIVVSQTCQIHQEIGQLLDQLREIAEDKGTGEPPIREKPEEYPAHRRERMMGFSGMMGPGAEPQPAGAPPGGAPGGPSAGDEETPPGGSAPPSGAAGRE